MAKLQIAIKTIATSERSVLYNTEGLNTQEDIIRETVDIFSAWTGRGGKHTGSIVENVRICYPETLFQDDCLIDEEQWFCVRTRARWEKKVSHWLVSLKQPHFLPLTRRRTVSHRKVRVTEIPLFPGYVFVNACQLPNGLKNSACVVRTLEPASPSEKKRLASQIQSVYLLLQHQGEVAFEPHLEKGQWVRVLSGPFSGTVGQFVSLKGQQKFIVHVDLLGVGASVDFPITTMVEKL